MSCPNITSPQWKALVSKIGEKNAWKEYIAYGTIPDADDYEQISKSYIDNQKPYKLLNNATNLKLSEEEVENIYNNYVQLMDRKREGKGLSKERFKKSIIEKLQVFKFNDTYIFGEWDNKNNIFKGRVISSPNIKQLYSSLDVLISNINFVASVPEDIGKMLEKKGMYKLNVDKLYNFKGDSIIKNLYFTNKELAEKAFNKKVEDINSNDVIKYDEFFNYFNLIDNLKKIYKNRDFDNLDKLYNILKSLGFYDYNAYKLSKKIKLNSITKDDIDKIVELIFKNTAINKVNINNNDILNNPKIYEELDTELNKTLAKYLSKFGIKTELLENLQDELGIDSFSYVDILNKIVYLNKNNQKDYPSSAGKIISYMMQYNPLITEIKKEMRKNGLFRKLITDDEILESIGDLISKELHDKTDTKLPESLIQSIKELIRQFFDFLNNIKISRINRNVGIIADSILLKNESLITESTFVPGKTGKKVVKVNLNEALEKDPFAKDIVNKLGETFILSGSIALSEQGTIYRPNENQVHDLDWSSPFDEKTSKDIFESLYKDSKFIRRIEDSNNIDVTNTWLIVPDGYKIQNLKIVGNKNIVKSYDIVDESNNIVSSFSNINDVEKFTNPNIEGKTIDIFTKNNNKDNNKTLKFKLESGKEINLSDWRDIFNAKLKYTRIKDIWDYNRFIPDIHIEFTSEDLGLNTNVTQEDFKCKI